METPVITFFSELVGSKSIQWIPGSVRIEQAGEQLNSFPTMPLPRVIIGVPTWKHFLPSPARNNHPSLALAWSGWIGTMQLGRINRIKIIKSVNLLLRSRPEQDPRGLRREAHLIYNFHLIKNGKQIRQRSGNHPSIWSGSGWLCYCWMEK